MDEVQNAKSVEKKPREQILMLGDVGAGKTFQFRTLKGKKFAYLFDPNAAATLAGSDIDYLEFLPDREDLDILTKRLKKDEQGAVGDKSKTVKPEPRTFLKWEADWTERYQSGFFDKYNWLMFDSLTAFSDVIMDRVQFLNNSLGKQPEQPDYSGEMTTMRNNLRIATSLCNLYCTAHVEAHRDEVTGKVFSRLVVTGKNRLRLPLLFSNIFGASCEVVEGKPQYQIVTVRSKDIPIARTTRKLSPSELVTCNMAADLVGQGLGKWF